MSRIDPKTNNPTRKYLKYKGSKGQWYYYDKDKDEDVYIDNPVIFCVLDVLSTIKGYSKEDDSFIYSNEVHSTVNEPLNVRTFKPSTIAKGLYSNIKKEIKAHGGKYCKSVYAIMKLDGEYEVVNLEMKGCALAGWIQFNNENNIYDGAVAFKRYTEEKNGQVEFKQPVFECYPISEETDEIAREKCKELKAYLNQYKQNQSEIDEFVTDEVTEQANDFVEEPVSFTRDKEELTTDEPIKEDNIPF